MRNPWRRIRELEVEVNNAAAGAAHQRRLAEAANSEVVRLQTLFDQERRRNDGLVERILTMKQQGFIATPLAREVPQESALPAEVQRALDAVGEPELEPMVRGWLAAGSDSEQVAQRILEGGSIPI